MEFKVLKSLVVFGPNGSRAYAEGEIMNSSEGDATGLVKEGIVERIEPKAVEPEPVEPTKKTKKVAKVM